MFLTLPPEVRLQIYSYLLHLPPPCSTDSSSPSPSSALVHAPILLTNHLINVEATSLLYSQNTFLAHPSLLTSFPRLRAYYPPIRSPNPLLLIRRFRLTLRLDCDLPFTPDAAAKALSGLEHLEIILVQSVFLGVGGSNLKALEGVRGVEDVVIGGSTTGFEEYVEWLKLLMCSAQGAAPCNVFEPSEVEGDVALRLNIMA